MNKVLSAYDVVIMTAHSIFKKKAHDYGTNWRLLRIISILDQLHIKSNRIKTIKETGVQKVNEVGDDIKSEFIGIINYSAMGCIQLQKQPSVSIDTKPEEAIALYEKALKQAQDDMLRRMEGRSEDDLINSCSVETLTTIILRTISSMKSSLNQKGEVISGNFKKNFLDIINYAIFALIILNKE